MGFEMEQLVKNTTHGKECEMEMHLHMADMNKRLVQLNNDHHHISNAKECKDLEQAIPPPVDSMTAPQLNPIEVSFSQEQQVQGIGFMS